MRLHSSLLSLAVLALCCPGVCLYGATITLGGNAIVNGDAESGTGVTNDSSVLPVPGWNTVGNFTAIQYATGLGFPGPGDPGPASRGVNFFTGGPTNASSSASQTVDTSNISAQIDLGLISFVLSGYLGGFIANGDNAVLTANFLDGSNANIGSSFIGPVTAADRANTTGLFFRTTSGTLPVGTRSILFNLQMTRLTGDYNDGYADNLSFVASSDVPEPGTIGMLAVGFSALAFASIRRVRPSSR